jgi:Skp family chaperone for outer membrane proteins
MKGVSVTASLALSVLALSVAPVLAQGVAKPAQPTTTPAPATTPAQPPAAPAAAAPALAPPAPFPVGAKVAFFNPQVVFQASADGKAAVTRVNALIAKKQKEAEDKAKLLQGNQQKLQTSGSVMNEAARTQLEKEIERMQKEGERFQQDAQAEVQELQQEVQNDFVKKMTPILDEVCKEKALQILLNANDGGIAWVAPGLDLTGEVVRRLDALSKPAAPAK